MAIYQLATGRWAGRMETLPLPMPQPTVLPLHLPLRIKLPPSSCRWWRT